MTDLNQITRRFLMGESKNISTGAVVQALAEIINSLKPRTVTEKNKLAMATRHLKELKTSFRRLEEQVSSLQEQVKMLEEISSMAAGSVEVGVGNLKTKKKKKEGLIR